MLQKGSHKSLYIGFLEGIKNVGDNVRRLYSKNVLYKLKMFVKGASTKACE